MDTTKTVTHVSLCAGYGGIDLGLKRVVAGLRTIAFSEIEAFACATAAPRRTSTCSFFQNRRGTSSTMRRLKNRRKLPRRCGQLAIRATSTSLSMSQSVTRRIEQRLGYWPRLVSSTRRETSAASGRFQPSHIRRRTLLHSILS